MPAFEFKGKSQVYAHHLTVPFRPLVPDPAKSVGDASPDGNLVIHGDNLHALKALLPRYADRVKCIYIDPPYNTGNEGWIYNDNANGSLLQSWYRAQEPVDGEDLERHDKWLTMMWPRLQLLKELLAEDGVIFVSIDDNEHHHLRMLMDDIFGERNFFVSQVRRAMHTVRNSSKDFNLDADYVLTYARNKEWFGKEPERYLRVVTDKSSRYPHDDDDGRGPYKLDPLHARNYYAPYEFVFGNGLKWKVPSGRFPVYSESRLRQLEKEGRIEFSGKEPRVKRYLAEVQAGQPPSAVLDPSMVGFNAGGTRQLREIFGEGGVFPQPKPVELVKYLIGLLRDPEAIVLDSFAGSGTTGQAVLELNAEDGGNRQFILVECEDYADTVTAERLRRVIAGVPGAPGERNAALREGLGGSFTFCDLGPPLDLEKVLTGKELPPYASLAAWLFHTATGISVESAGLRPLDDDGLFSRHGETDYYLLYEPDLDWLRSEQSVLNERRARSIRDARSDRRRNAVVFAPAKYMSEQDLTNEFRITFCQLPYEIWRERGGGG